MFFQKRTLFLALTAALILMLITGLIHTLAGSSHGELIRNGDFEKGFRLVDGCGMVGVDWGCFTTGGAGGYGFYDEAWGPVVATGAHAQLIEVNTKEIGGDQNRTAGIYQVVDVIPGETYTLSFNGMIRANDFDDPGADPWRYVMLVGFAHNGSTQWADAQVQEVNVGPIQDRVNPTRGYYHVQLQVTAQGNKLTVFIAGRMKWGDWYKEADFDVDTVSLRGPKPGASWGKVRGTRVAQKQPTPTPIPEGQAICDGPNLLQNPGFEKGFDADGTAKKWGKFNNGGRANYGYYDEQWKPVVAQGKHAQLLEINSKGYMPTDADRWIGIHQRVKGLQPGGTYQLSFKAMIREREDHSDEDPWRYEVYWGVHDNAGKISDVSELAILKGASISPIYLRTEPGTYTSFSTTFQAPSSVIRLYLLGLKKWATSEREVDFDFDEVSLRACRSVAPAQKGAQAEASPEASQGQEEESDQSAQNGQPSQGKGGGNAPSPGETNLCTYIVQPGDYLSLIAERFHVTVEWLMKTNHIASPGILFVGQPLFVPCQGNEPESMRIPSGNPGPSHVVAGAPSPPPPPPGQEENIIREPDQRARPGSGTQQEDDTVVHP